jgi:hypothetical protein
MDLLDLTFRETYVYNILHPITKEPVLNKDGSPQWVEVYGSDTRHYRNALAEVARLGIEDPTEKLVAFLARITVDWSITAGNTSPLVERAAEIYPRLPDWLRDDIFAAAASRANFFGETSARS